jgi:hypothetical protein
MKKSKNLTQSREDAKEPQRKPLMLSFALSWRLSPLPYAIMKRGVEAPLRALLTFSSVAVHLSSVL